MVETSALGSDEVDAYCVVEDVRVIDEGAKCSLERGGMRAIQGKHYYFSCWCEDGHGYARCRYIM